MVIPNNPMPPALSKARLGNVVWWKLEHAVDRRFMRLVAQHEFFAIDQGPTDILKR